MTEEYGAAAGSLGGAHGGGGGNSGLGMRMSSYDERLQEMRKHLRRQQEKQKRAELRRKNREKEMAQKWVDFQAEERRTREQEVKERLTHLDRSKVPQNASRKATETDASPRQREHMANGGNGGTSTGAKAEAAASSGRDSLCLTTDGNRGSQRGSITAPVAGDDISHTMTNTLSCESAAAAGQEISKKAGAGTLPRVRKKKREDGATAAPLRTGASGEKSIMQQAQEQFQGLCRSVDGRAILELGTRQQRMHREALVRLDPLAVERAEQQHEENGEEEQEAEDQQQPIISNENGHMARKYRLRSMRQITAQVLQCRRKMAGSLMSNFMSSTGMEFGPQDDACGPRPSSLSDDSDDKPGQSFLPAYFDSRSIRA